MATFAWAISSMVWGAGRELYTWWAVVFSILVLVGLASSAARLAPESVEEMIDRALAARSHPEPSRSPATGANG